MRKHGPVLVQCTDSVVFPRPQCSALQNLVHDARNGLQGFNMLMSCMSSSDIMGAWSASQWQRNQALVHTLAMEVEAMVEADALNTNCHDYNYLVHLDML